MLTGDAEQDKPFCISNNVSLNDDNPLVAALANYFKAQYITPFGARFKAAARNHMIFLTKNFRQHSGLELLSSELFYNGEMKSGLDPKPTTTAQMWYQWAQNLIRRDHEKRPPKPKDQAAEFLTYNRITYAARSNRTMIGLSSIDLIQAQRAANFAALVHQSGIPGKDDSRRPTICIITPYSAQVDEIRKFVRKLSPQEACRELIEVRTQTASTGGEWDVVINVFVRDESMGFLSDHFRLNVMWTRARYLVIDIMNLDFFQRAKGKGAYVMRSYHDETVRNGALIVDRRNWGQVCGFCFEAHSKTCQNTPECTFCGEDHHARKCTSDKAMTADIPEERRFKLQPIAVDRPKIVTDFVVLDTSNAPPEEPQDEEKEARDLDFEAEQEIQQYVSDLNAAPLEFQQPATVEPIQEDIYGVSDEEDNNDDDIASDDGGEIMKVKLTNKKRQPVVLDTEKPGWTGITATGVTAAETQDTQTQDTPATASKDTPAWQNNTTSGETSAKAPKDDAPKDDTPN